MFMRFGVGGVLSFYVLSFYCVMSNVLSEKEPADNSVAYPPKSEILMLDGKLQTKVRGLTLLISFY